MFQAHLRVTLAANSVKILDWVILIYLRFLAKEILEKYSVSTYELGDACRA